MVALRHCLFLSLFVAYAQASTPSFTQAALANDILRRDADAVLKTAYAIKATHTSSSTTASSTGAAPSCTNYILQFEADCCPRKSIVKKPAKTHKTTVHHKHHQHHKKAHLRHHSRMLKARQPATTTAASASNQQTAGTTTSTSTMRASNTTSSAQPSATIYNCKQVFVPTYHCPKSHKADKKVAAAEYAFLQFYKKEIQPGWPSLEVRCDNDIQEYIFP